jgi:hypothetical protein
MKLVYLTAAAVAAALVSVPACGALAAKSKSAKPKEEYLRAAVSAPTPAATKPRAKKATKAQ